MIYNGQFKDGDRHGLGRLVDETGKEILKSGKWFQGRFKRSELEKDKKEAEEVQKKVKALILNKSKI